MDRFLPDLQLPKAKIKKPTASASVGKSQKWAKSCVFMSIPMFLRVRQVILWHSTRANVQLQMMSIIVPNFHTLGCFLYRKIHSMFMFHRKVHAYCTGGRPNYRKILSSVAGFFAKKPSNSSGNLTSFSFFFAAAFMINRAVQKLSAKYEYYYVV